MEVILLKDVEKLGSRGEVVSVKDGFGRNFLLPRGLASPATRENRVQIEAERERAGKRSAREQADAEALASRLASVRLRLEVSVAGKDKLFGSVTSQDLVEALEREGIALSRKQVYLPEPIRSLGIHSVRVKLHPEVNSTLQVEVVKKS